MPCSENGKSEVAFVVSKDVLAYMSIIEIFEETEANVISKHFSTEEEEEALNWLNKEPEIPKKGIKTDITYKGVDKNGSAVIEVKSASSDLISTIKSFENLISKNDFIKSNIDKYASLTTREKEVVILSAKGQKHQEIANHLHISLHTVRTHWRNIKKKLNLSSLAEIIKYADAFDMK